MNKVQYFEENTTGRDFIIGDLHGCAETLLNALLQLNFNPKIDRLFSTGDLIDRGPQSFEAANLIYEKWFFSVQGNHELLMAQSILHQNPAYIDCWMQNGGAWFQYEDEQLIIDIAKRFSQLPLIISIGKGNKRINIVHSELIKHDHYHRISLS